MWEPGNFLVAAPYSMLPQQSYGYVYKGLALRQWSKGSPKGRRPPSWILTHIGSGHRVAMLHGFVATSFPVATEIADEADWSFDGLYGWRNREPELPEKVKRWADRHPKIVKLGTGAGSDEAAARAVAMALA